jgi:NAD-dependent deacetylase
MSSNKYTIPTELIELLRSAERVTVMTGAGISAESGVPTFRDAQTGLWAKYDPQELATPQAFRQNPRLVWEWYTWRRELIANTRPNAGHIALARLEQLLPNLTLITQNIDGLHQAAGSSNLIELHGNIARTKCFEDGRIIESWPESGDIPPRCPHCSGLLRPDVVWFHESLPAAPLAQAIDESQNSNIFFSIGTSALVQPAASLAHEARHNGATLVEINLEPTPLTPYTNYALHGAAAAILPALVEQAFSEKTASP